MRGGGSSRLLIMSLRDSTTKQTGHFRPTRRAACFLAPFCGVAVPSVSGTPSRLLVEHRMVIRWLIQCRKPTTGLSPRCSVTRCFAKRPKITPSQSRPLLGQAPWMLRRRTLSQNFFHVNGVNINPSRIIWRCRSLGLRASRFRFQGRFCKAEFMQPEIGI